MNTIAGARREPFSPGHLTLGIKCGGSAGNSGLLSNVVVGRTVDALSAGQGSAIFSETTFQAFTPKFVKKYANIAEEMGRAMAAYAAEVKGVKFPQEEHTYGMLAGEHEKLEALIAAGSEIG